MSNKINIPFGYSVGDLRPLALHRRAVLVGECSAAKVNGEPCRCYVVKGQVFCKKHLEQGYALFTLAAISSIHGNRRGYLTDRSLKV